MLRPDIYYDSRTGVGSSQINIWACPALDSDVQLTWNNQAGRSTNPNFYLVNGLIYSALSAYELEADEENDRVRLTWVPVVTLEQPVTVALAATPYQDPGSKRGLIHLLNQEAAPVILNVVSEDYSFVETVRLEVLERC